MSTDIIISYDGTPNDDDAIALGKALARGGASVALAYVRHSREFDQAREELAQHDAQRRLEQGATLLGDPDTPRHVVVSASTGLGLARLASEENAAMVVFGSDYRTPPGHVEPGTTAQNLLEGGPVAVAVAPAGLRTNADPTIETIAVDGTEPDPVLQESAQALASKLGASVAGNGSMPADLILVGSPPGSAAGRITLSGASRARLNSARSAVLVIPRDAVVSL
jgi:nucleotide-binding universal stress UspA family protein